MRVGLIVGVLALTGCAGLSHEPPVSTAQSMAGGPPSQMPQSPNSLPLGSQVSAPFTPDVGNVSSMRVGPSSGAVPVTSARQPHVGTGTATEDGTGHSVTNSY
jgi:hypothetical protein